MIVLVCNAGSTSLKFKLYDMPGERVLCQCKIERVGSRGNASISYQNQGRDIRLKAEDQDIPSYKTGISRFLEYLATGETAALPDLREIERVGFKTVLAKGYYGIHELTPPVLSAMEEMLTLAPAHNGIYLEAIRTMREALSATVFIGAFETAFHQTIPLSARFMAFPIPGTAGTASAGWAPRSFAQLCS